MGKDAKKSLLEDALTDYKHIQEAAEATAAKKLADEFPDKFQNLIKEELNNKKNSEKEPYKKVVKEESTRLDESEENKDETIMKKDKKETKQVIKEEREKSFTADVENDTPNLGKGETEKGDTFVDDIKRGDTNNLESGDNKPISNLKEDFDITDLDIEGAEGAIDGADSGDEVITMDEIEKEINEMEHLKGELEKESEPFDEKIGALKNQLQEMLDSLGDAPQLADDELAEQKKQGGKQNYTGREKGGPTTQMVDEENVAEQKKQGGKQNYTGREKGGPTTQMVDEEDLPNIDDVELDEAMGIAHSSSKHVAGDHLPGKEFAQQRHKRYGSVNSQNEGVEKKFKSLIDENKKLAKKINESKKYKETVDQLLENYKTALGKYRSQLKEMAVFNTNLSHVNNLLVNESIALTQEDKIKIINDFKVVNTIGESKEKYDKILTEMKEEKKTISESIEEKVTDSVASSSKQKLDEVVEKTAYENDDHIKKIKNLIEYVEKHDKKIIKD